MSKTPAELARMLVEQRQRRANLSARERDEEAGLSEATQRKMADIWAALTTRVVPALVEAQAAFKLGEFEINEQFADRSRSNLVSVTFGLKDGAAIAIRSVAGEVDTRWARRPRRPGGEVPGAPQDASALTRETALRLVEEIVKAS
jgi:hypothetical protein